MTFAPAEDALWQEYRARLFRFVLSRVGDEATAEDIVHDALVRGYQKRGTLRNGTKFEQWLYQITRNAVIDHYRARRPTEPLPPDLVQHEDAAGGNARRELATCMRPLIGSLPEPYRRAVLLSEIEGLTQQETARRLDLSLSGAKSRIQRGRRMIEERLLDCCRVELDTRGSIVDYEPHAACRSDAEGGGCGAGVGESA